MEVWFITLGWTTTAFMYCQSNRFGYLVEYDKTQKIFENPQEQTTKEYISGNFG